MSFVNPTPDSELDAENAARAAQRTKEKALTSNEQGRPLSDAQRRRVFVQHLLSAIDALDIRNAYHGPMGPDRAILTTLVGYLSGDPSAPETPKNGLVNEFDAIKAAIQADPEYGWSWHCNIAMPMLDAKVGITPEQANDAAAYVMQHLFRFDPRQCKEWQWRKGAQETTESRERLPPVGVPNGANRPASPLDRKVTVCAACLCASCWQGEFYCQDYKTAATVEKTVRELYQGNAREDSGYWFKDANTGEVDYDAKSAAKRAWLAENGKGDGNG